MKENIILIQNKLTYISLECSLLSFEQTEYSQTYANGHLLTTARKSPARLILIPIFY
jgi:hypothetical protein